MNWRPFSSPHSCSSGVLLQACLQHQEQTALGAPVQPSAGSNLKAFAWLAFCFRFYVKWLFVC